jgi:hypothetical protein
VRILIKNIFILHYQETFFCMSMTGLLPKTLVRRATTMAAATSEVVKPAGDISSVFPSLRPDYKPEPLPSRFQDLKKSFFVKNEDPLKDSWVRLLRSLEQEVALIKERGTDVSKFGAPFGLAYLTSSRSFLRYLTKMLSLVDSVSRSKMRYGIEELL